MPPCDLLHIYREQGYLVRVSILVLVDAALRHDQHETNRLHKLVSILVLVDAALRPYYLDQMEESDVGVSILVLVDAALRQKLICQLLVFLKVSILVLVDAALRLVI